MNDIMIQNYLIVGPCIVGALISLFVFIKKSKQSTYDENDIRNDIRKNHVSDIKNLIKQSKKRAKQIAKHA